MNRYRTVRPLSATAAAYIAGLVDGEGTVTLSRHHAGENRRLAVSVANTELPLLRFLVRRLLLAVPVLLGVTTLTFIIMTISAGNYVPGLDLAVNLRPGDVEKMRASLGLDRPLYVQYLAFLNNLVHGDLGVSIRTKEPVVDDLGRYFPASVELAVTAVFFAVLIGIPLVVVAYQFFYCWQLFTGRRD